MPETNHADDGGARRYMVDGRPVMTTAIDVVSLVETHKNVLICAKGRNIPNAVAVANIVTENMLDGSSHIARVKIDSDAPAGIGAMTSIIEILVSR